MKKIGTSTLFEHKYRPQCVEDLILPPNIKEYFLSIIKQKDVPNTILSGGPGKGKTTVALALCNDLNCDKLYINGSLETSIDVLREKVSQFASTSSMFNTKKIVFIDEFERISANGADAMKGILDKVEKNCRFILATNYLSKVPDPLKSRCDLINFDFPEEDTKLLMSSYFKRILWILEQENITYNKKIVAEYIKETYPDFRKILNGLQKFHKMYGNIDERILFQSDNNKIEQLIEEIKNKKFNNIRKLCSEVNPEQFYSTFYEEIDNHLDDSCKPDVILTLAQYAYEHSLSIDKEITLAACAISLVKGAKFK